jgi:hypothetical protein
MIEILIFAPIILATWLMGLAAIFFIVYAIVEWLRD